MLADDRDLRGPLPRGVQDGRRLSRRLHAHRGLGGLPHPGRGRRRAPAGEARRRGPHHRRPERRAPAARAGPHGHEPDPQGLRRGAGGPRPRAHGRAGAIQARRRGDEDQGGGHPLRDDGRLGRQPPHRGAPAHREAQRRRDVLRPQRLHHLLRGAAARAGHPRPQPLPGRHRADHPGLPRPHRQVHGRRHHVRVRGAARQRRLPAAGGAGRHQDPGARRRRRLPVDDAHRHRLRPGHHRHDRLPATDVHGHRRRGEPGLAAGEAGGTGQDPHRPLHLRGRRPLHRGPQEARPAPARGPRCRARAPAGIAPRADDRRRHRRRAVLQDRPAPPGAERAGGGPAVLRARAPARPQPRALQGGLRRGPAAAGLQRQRHHQHQGQAQARGGLRGGRAPRSARRPREDPRGLLQRVPARRPAHPGAGRPDPAGGGPRRPHRPRHHGGACSRTPSRMCWASPSTIA